LPWASTKVRPCQPVTREHDRYILLRLIGPSRVQYSTVPKAEACAFRLQLIERKKLAWRPILAQKQTCAKQGRLSSKKKLARRKWLSRWIVIF
jgi:hypothetical protein